MVTQEINRILKRYNNDASDIIAILQDLQNIYRYLPQDALENIADKLNIPISRIYHLATFFRAFSLEPRGKHELHVCMGTACHVRGAPRILDAMERKLKIKVGKTTADRNFTLETVNCVGACALGPVVVVDGKAKSKLNIQKAERMMKQMQSEASAAAKPKKVAGASKASAKKKVSAKNKPLSAKAKTKSGVASKKKIPLSVKAKPTSVKKRVAGTKKTTKKARR